MSLFPRLPNNDFNTLFRMLDDYNTSSGKSYELQGELPGIDQKDVHLEFADSHTLVIKGHVEREYSSEAKATVEDEDTEAKKAVDANGTAGSKPEPKQTHQAPGVPKYWVAERSVGEFHRAFTLPSRVDQDVVKARLNNGISNVTVPKATEHKAKRIMVE